MDTKSQILDIAMNLNRVGNWAADGYEERKEKIKVFLENTSGYIQNIDQTKLPSSFAGTFSEFKKEYFELERAGLNGPENTLYWAENMMTWGNILAHRSNLL